MCAVLKVAQQPSPRLRQLAEGMTEIVAKTYPQTLLQKLNTPGRNNQLGKNTARGV